MNGQRMLATMCLTLIATVAGAEETVLFDFEDAAEIADWQQLRLEDKSLRGADEPAVKIELAAEGATSGRQALKLTFSGGQYPTVACVKLPQPGRWSGFKTFRADVTVPRECAVVFRVMYEKSVRTWGWDQNYTRTVKIARCEKGLNRVVDWIRFAGGGPSGQPVSLEIYMLRPRPGESITVDNIRLADERPDHATPFRERNPHYVGEDLARAAQYPWFPMPKELKVYGEDLVVKSAKDLGDLKKHLWVKPNRRTVEEVEASWRALYDEIRKEHPRAVAALFRRGDKGFDPKAPEKVFDGFEDCYMLAHDPGNQFESVLGQTPGKAVHSEVFVHRRSTLWRVDFSSVPKGSTILAARFFFAKRFTETETWEKVKPGDAYWDFSPLKPTLYIAMPVNRPWVETEASGFEWARDRLWKETCGMSWDGDDPDILPVILAYGQTGVNNAEFDVTRLVGYFTDGTHPNNGFTLACPLGYFHNNNIWTSEAPVLKDRPALMVLYEPK